MKRKKSQTATKLLDFWIRICIRKNRRFFSRQTEKEIAGLNPGMDSRKLVYEHYREKISLCLMIFGMVFLMICLYFISCKTEHLLYEERYLERTAADGEERSVELDVQIGNMELKGLSIPVSGRSMGEEEAKQRIAEVAEKLPAIILGENAALTYVNHPLNLPSSWEDTLISISWNSSNTDLLLADGSFGTGEIPEKGEKVLLTATISYETFVQKKEIVVMLYPQELSPEEKAEKELRLLLAREQDKSRTEEYLSLPQFLKDTQIIWKEPKGELLPLLLLLLFATPAAVFVGKDKDIHKRWEERNKQLLLEYPEFISKLQLLICSGMSIRSAFLKMGKEYQKNLQKGGRKKYVSEELLLALRKMENGMSEMEALEYFGKRCHLFRYKKLMSLIQQNLKRGTEGLRDALVNETKMAFEQRKQTARRLGEEAGTKLLFPMMLMMGIVMIIIMMPAYFSFGGIGS